MTYTCPTCGCPVKVVSDPDGEGTNHYEPIPISEDRSFALGVQAKMGIFDEKIQTLKKAVRELIAIVETGEYGVNRAKEYRKLVE
jgi:hypothetical protein